MPPAPPQHLPAQGAHGWPDLWRKQELSHGHVPGWDTASQCQAGLRQGADSGIYGARPEAVLGIVPLPGTSLFTQQDVAFRRMAQVMPPENRAIFWEKG